MFHDFYYTFLCMLHRCLVKQNFKQYTSIYQYTYRFGYTKVNKYFINYAYIENGRREKFIIAAMTVVKFNILRSRRIPYASGSNIASRQLMRLSCKQITEQDSKIRQVSDSKHNLSRRVLKTSLLIFILC